MSDVIKKLDAGKGQFHKAIDRAMRSECASTDRLCKKLYDEGKEAEKEIFDTFADAHAEILALRAREAKLREACAAWLVAHDENMHILTNGMNSPTDVKQAVSDGIKEIRKALAESESK